MKPRVLFVFTKEYPLGKREQYIESEQVFLSNAFDKVVFIPSEWFSSDKTSRPIPANCEILDLNSVAESRGKRKGIRELVSVLMAEWRLSSHKRWIWKERKRHIGILTHQQDLANTFSSVLSEKFRDTECYFYSYWLHNSSLMLALLKRRGVVSNYICRAHSIDLYGWEWYSVKKGLLNVMPFYDFNLRNASAIFPISKHGSDFLTQTFPFLRTRIKCFHLGVNDTGQNPFEKETRYTIVTVSDTIRSKGLHHIPGILEQLTFPVTWIHFGGEGDVSEILRTQVSRMPSNVHVELRGYTPNKAIKDFYRSETVHLFMNLSEVEGISVSIMEAVSFGIPVIATSVYGTPEIVNDQTGFLVPLDFDKTAVAELIKRLRSDESLQLRLRESTRRFFLQHFFAPANFNAFIEEVRTFPNTFTSRN